MDNIYVGDTVETTNGRIGIVRYIGNIHIKKGIWIGIEFNEPSGNHDGKINGKRYFKTPPNHATFVKFKKINKVIKSVNNDKKRELSKKQKKKPKPIDIEPESSADAFDISSNNKSPEAIKEEQQNQKESNFDSFNDEVITGSNIEEDIDIDSDDNYFKSKLNEKIDIDIPSTPNSENKSDILSPPPMPTKSSNKTSFDETDDSNINVINAVDLDEHTGDFDIAAFEIIKVKKTKF